MECENSNIANTEGKLTGFSFINSPKTVVIPLFVEILI